MNLEKLKSKRLEKKLTLLDMAKVLGLKTASTYQKYETGKYRLRADMLPKIAQTLETSIEYFFN